MQVHRQPGSADLEDVLERLFENGIVVDPATRISLGGLNAAECTIVLEEDEADLCLAA